MKKNLAKIGISAAAFLSSASLVLAEPINVQPAEVPNITVGGIITTLIRIIIILAFVIAFIVLLIGGIRWMTAGGDPKNIEGARNMVTAALIGLVIVLAAFALIRLVELVFGINIGFGGGEVTLPQIPQAGT